MTVNGNSSAVTIEGAQGEVKIESSYKPVIVNDIQGGLWVRATSADVSAAADFGRRRDRKFLQSRRAD